jgi:hypothetical protein
MMALGGRGDSFHHQGWILMMEAVRTSETSVDNHFTRQYIPEDNSEHHTRRRENLKSYKNLPVDFAMTVRNRKSLENCVTLFMLGSIIKKNGNSFQI